MKGEKVRLCDAVVMPMEKRRQLHSEWQRRHQQPQRIKRSSTTSSPQLHPRPRLLANSPSLWWPMSPKAAHCMASCSAAIAASSTTFPSPPSLHPKAPPPPPPQPPGQGGGEWTAPTERLVAALRKGGRQRRGWVGGRGGGKEGEEWWRHDKGRRPQAVGKDGD